MKNLVALSYPTCWMDSCIPRLQLKCKDHVNPYSRFFHSPVQPRRTITFGVVLWSSMDSVRIGDDGGYGDGTPSEEETEIQRILLTMPVIDIQLELQERGVEHRDEFEKVGLVKRLAHARIESKKRALECTPYSDEYNANMLEPKEMGVEVTAARLQKIGSNFSRLLDEDKLVVKYADACLAVRSTALPTEQSLGKSEPSKEAFQQHGAMLSTRELLDFLEIMGDPHSPLDSRNVLVGAYVTCCLRESSGLEDAPFQKLSGQQPATPPPPLSRGPASSGPILFGSYDAALTWSSHLPFDDLLEELDQRGLSVNSDPGEEGPIAWSKQATRVLAGTVMIEERSPINRKRQRSRRKYGGAKGTKKKSKNPYGRVHAHGGGGEIVDKRLDSSLEATASEAFANAASAVQSVVTGWTHPERGDDEPNMGLQEIRRVLGNTVTSSSTRAVLGILGSTATACVHSVEAIAEWAGGRLINREHIILGVCLFSLALRRGLWSTLLLILAVRTVRITAERIVSAGAGHVPPTRKKKKVFVKKKRKDWSSQTGNYNHIAAREFVQ